ncbi:MAG: ABC transporter ATP-binding protein, partial [Propionibacterium sp.]
TRLGTVFQNPEHQFIASSVGAEIAAGPKALKLARDAIDAKVDELLERLRLNSLREANPFTLSGGEKRRLSVATVLATSPRVIFLDEPTFGQDRNTWAEMVALVANQIETGRTVVSVTHDRDYIAAAGSCELKLGAL